MRPLAFAFAFNFNVYYTPFLLYNTRVQGQIENPYEYEQRRDKFFKKVEYALVLVLRAIFHIIKLVLKMIWGVTKNVLKTLGVPIK
jgi:hypothetical protein